MKFVKIYGMLFNATTDKVVTEDKYIKGGYMVLTANERDSLNEAQKKIGMVVYSTDTKKEYRWNGTSWDEIKNVVTYNAQENDTEELITYLASNYANLKQSEKIVVTVNTSTAGESEEITNVYLLEKWNKTDFETEVTTYGFKLYDMNYNVYNVTITNLSSGTYTYTVTNDVTNLKFTNVPVDNWVTDTTYTDYSYKAAISLNGVTDSMIAEVVFGLTEADSGNYAPICETYNGGVYVYSKVNTAITISTVLVVK